MYIVFSEEECYICCLKLFVMEMNPLKSEKCLSRGALILKLSREQNHENYDNTGSESHTKEPRQTLLCTEASEPSSEGSQNIIPCDTSPIIISANKCDRNSQVLDNPQQNLESTSTSDGTSEGKFVTILPHCLRIEPTKYFGDRHFTML
ncbi:uncharacterized protein [Leptinotarsa decemlineata]|uniref:uncharacterized protein n=1 Tax=Leptinotarsa decemlineata TaxID=7539 RepID=UPI003D309190